MKAAGQRMLQRLQEIEQMRQKTSVQRLAA